MVIRVTKATGEVEEFSETKLRDSIRRAGIPQDMQDAVVSHVKEKLYDMIPTSEVYRHITEFFKKEHPFANARYGLKNAIMALGPTGYPFEDFIAQVLQTQGYSTQVRTILQGSCISHEIDVIAQDMKQQKKLMVEAKYHNLPGNKTNVHVALYTKARFDDLKDRYGFTQGWLITNTKVTTDAIAYADCMGMRITSWSYPQGESLREIIERSGLSPITSLTTLSQSHKEELVKNNIVLSKDLYGKPESLEHLRLPEHEMKKIIEEARFVSNPQ